MNCDEKKAFKHEMVSRHNLLKYKDKMFITCKPMKNCHKVKPRPWRKNGNIKRTSRHIM
jgi:uncharacterized protein (DUF1919 family)